MVGIATHRNDNNRENLRFPHAEIGPDNDGGYTPITSSQIEGIISNFGGDMEFKVITFNSDATQEQPLPSAVLTRANDGPTHAYTANQIAEMLGHTEGWGKWMRTDSSLIAGCKLIIDLNSDGTYTLYASYPSESISEIYKIFYDTQTARLEIFWTRLGFTKVYGENGSVAFEYTTS